MNIIYHESYLNFGGILNDDNDLQSSNIKLILVTLLISHLEISGKDDNALQPLNIKLILVTFAVFHLEISDGNEDNDLQQLNK